MIGLLKFFLIYLLLTISVSGAPASLFTDSPITELTGIPSAPTGLIVLVCYAPWCGHCQHFAPQYITFAREYYLSEGYISARDAGSPAAPAPVMAALNCVTKRDICNSLKITGFPTVLLYNGSQGI